MMSNGPSKLGERLPKTYGSGTLVYRVLWVNMVVNNS
jgi:hypothetical protein